MTPESPLFTEYETQLDGQIAELEFARRINAALDTIDKDEIRTGSARLMMDSQSIGHIVMGSTLPDATRVGRSIHVDRDRGNPEGQPTTAYMTPKFDEIERGEISCATYVAHLEPMGHSAYSVYRIVALPSEQTTLSDGRGYYVARNKEDKSITMFQIKGEALKSRGTPVGPGEPYYPRLEVVPKDKQQPVLDELEKAAAAIRALPPRSRGSWR